MKREPARQTARRYFFLLTSEEKKTVSFVLVTVLVGIAAANYRQRHTLPPQRTAIAETAKTVSLPAQKRAEAKRRKLMK